MAANGGSKTFVIAFDGRKFSVSDPCIASGLTMTSASGHPPGGEEDVLEREGAGACEVLCAGRDDAASETSLMSNGVARARMSRDPRSRTSPNSRDGRMGPFQARDRGAQRGARDSGRVPHQTSFPRWEGG
jgi:hypothetical protein